jgi:hypothetical protein
VHPSARQGKLSGHRTAPRLEARHPSAVGLPLTQLVSSSRRTPMNELSLVILMIFPPQAWSANTSGGSLRRFCSARLFPSGLPRSRHGRECKSHRGSRAYLYISMRYSASLDCRGSHKRLVQFGGGRIPRSDRPPFADATGPATAVGFEIHVTESSPPASLPSFNYLQRRRRSGHRSSARRANHRGEVAASTRPSPDAE